MIPFARNRLSFLLVLTLLFQASLVAAFTYTTNWYDAAGNPVNGVRALTYRCLDSSCENPLGAHLQNSSNANNTLLLSYPVPAPQFGYATFFYAQCFLDQELAFTPTQDGSYTANARFDKAQDCAAPIATFTAAPNITVNQTLNFTATVQSALVELDHLPRGEPQDLAIQEQFYHAETTLTLTIIDAQSRAVSTQSHTLQIPRSTTLPASFSWRPTAAGTYQATLRTVVPDCKCSSTLERSRTLSFIVANTTNGTNTTNYPPTVTITAPVNGSNATNGTVLSFTGTGTDIEDGTLSGSQLVWASSIDGLLGAGTSISAALSVGVHEITLTGTDTDGASDSDRIILIVTRPTIGTPAAAVLQINTSTNTANGTEPFMVSFTCIGDGDAPLQYLLMFGDGQSASVASATHTYVQQGSYLATCTVTDADSEHATASQLLTVYDTLPLAAFTAAPNPQYEDLSVQFTDVSTAYDQPLTHFWNFGDGSTSTLRTPAHAYTLPGMYAAVLTVTDADGSTSTAREDLLVLNATNQTNVTNRPPIVDIILPSVPSFIQGIRITFAGSGIDPEDGVLSGGALIWTSDINGVFGIGQTFDSSALLAGTHTITLTGQDLQGLTASDRITLTILANQTNQTDSTPVVRFTTNHTNTTNSSTLLGAEPFAVLFDCSATGDLPIFTFIDFGDGEATPLQQVQHTYRQNGIYRATCTAIDADGDRAMQDLTIIVSDSAPIAEFTFTPTLPREGEGIQFADASVGYDQPLAYLWNFGDSSTSTLRNPAHDYAAPGSYLVTLRVTDADGTLATISHLLTIEPLTPSNNTPPNATITRPADGSTFPLGAIAFEGFGLDREDGVLSGSQLSWVSSIDGLLGTGSILPRTFLSEGLHLITLTATDGLYATGSTSILLRINASAPNNNTNNTNTSNTPPNATIIRPADGATFIIGSPVIFEGIGRDREDGVLSGSQLAWRSDRDGALGTGDLLGTTLLTLGTHQITLTATDGLAATGSASITLTIINPNSTNQTNDTLAPVVELQLPSNSTTLTDDDVVFTYRVTDDRDAVLECTLYTDRLGLFAAEQTQLSPSGAADTFTLLNFADGTYRWNVECRDDAGNVAFAPADFLFTIDAVPAPAACADGLDNDGDGLTDFGAAALNDPGCASSTDSSELNAAIACDDGQDNDLDTFTDFPDDLGCTSPLDNDEQNPVTPECSDSIDNDGDTFIDYPADPGCSALTDISEDPFNSPQPPAAGFTISMFASPVHGEAPLAVRFGVNVYGGTAPYTYGWQFDDGQSATLAQRTHIYDDAGRYHARVTVTDANGIQRVQSQLIVVSEGQNAESLYIRSIRINDDIDPTVRPGDDLEVALDLELRDGDIPDRLSIRATLMGPAGVESVGANVLLRPFRRHGRISPILFVQVPTGAASGTYDLRISITDENGRTRSKHRDVVVQ